MTDLDPPGGDLDVGIGEPGGDPDRFSDPVADLLDRIGLTWGRVWLLALAVYGVGEKIVLPAALGYLELSGPTSNWRPDVEALVSGFVFAPAMLAAYRWQVDGAHQIFVEFARGESFDDERAFRRFQAKASGWFARPWWILSLVVAVVGVLIQQFWLWDPDNPKPVEPWWTEGGITPRVVALVLGAPLWFATSQIVIGQLRLGHILSRLWTDLRDHYRLISLGRFGGIRSLSANLTVLTSIAAIVFLNIVLGVLLPEMRRSQATPDFLRWALLIWSTYMLIVPGIAIFLLWPAHRTMEKAKEDRIGSVAAAIDRLLWRTEEDVKQQRSLDPEEIDELERLHELRDWLESDLPIWPLPKPARAVSWSTVIPIALTVLTIVLEQPW